MRGKEKKGNGSPGCGGVSRPSMEDKGMRTMGMRTMMKVHTR